MQKELKNLESNIQNVGKENLEIMLAQEYNLLIEELRKRLNIIGTSVFLLKDINDEKDPKQSRYLDKINSEMEKIRCLISTYSRHT